MKNFFYGWIMLVAGLVPVTMSYGMVYNTAGLFLNSIVAEFNISRTQFALNFTIMSLALMLCMPQVGRLCQRLSIKAVLSFGVILVACGCLGYAGAHSIYRFYPFTVLIGLGLACISSVTVSLLVNRWFVQSRGTAIGIAMSGTGLGGLVFTQVANYLMSDYGWRVTYVVYAVILIAVTLPVILFVICGSPGEKGLKPYGRVAVAETGLLKDEKTVDAVEPIPENTGISFAEARKTKDFWKILIGISLLTFILMGTYTTIPVYLADCGYAANTIANVMSALLGFMMIGKILIGGLYDKIGSAKVIQLLCGQMFISILCIINIKNIPCLVLFSIVYGLCMGGIGDILAPLLVGETFGQKEYGRIFANVSCIAGILSSMSGIAMNLVFEYTQSYTVAWYGALVAIPAVLLVMAKLKSYL